jgi:hypothetical protein
MSTTLPSPRIVALHLDDPVEVRDDLLDHVEPYAPPRGLRNLFGGAESRHEHESVNFFAKVIL